MLGICFIQGALDGSSSIWTLIETPAIHKVLLRLLTYTVPIQYTQERRVPKAWKRAADKSEEQLRSANGDEASATS